MGSSIDTDHNDDTKTKPLDLEHDIFFLMVIQVLFWICCVPNCFNTIYEILTIIQYPLYELKYLKFHKINRTTNTFLKIIVSCIDGKIVRNVSIMRLNTKYVCVHNVNDTDFFQWILLISDPFMFIWIINMSKILNIP